MGALALGAQRLLPALQLMYSSWASLKSCNAAIQGVLAMLSQPLPPQVQVALPMPLRESIRLEGLHFQYGPEQPEVLRGLDLEIRRGERIGLIGSTGSGKSTTVDLLMGLLPPPAAGCWWMDSICTTLPMPNSWRVGERRWPMYPRAFTWQTAQLLKILPSVCPLTQLI